MIGSLWHLQDVEADVAVDIDVGMETRGYELDGGRGAGVVVGEGEGELVGEPCKGDEGIASEGAIWEALLGSSDSKGHMVSNAPQARPDSCAANVVRESAASPLSNNVTRP